MSHARIVTAASAAEARAHGQAWRRLQAGSLDPNVFLAAEFLLPLVERREAKRPVRLVFVYGADDEMIGLAAFGEPVPLVAMGPAKLPTWGDHYFLDATPLLHRDHAEVAADALVGWLDGADRPWSLISWDRISLGSATWRRLEAAAADRGRRSWTRHSYLRPEMRCRESFDEFLAELPSKRRGKLRWRMNRLDKEGDLEVLLHRDLDDGGLLDRFLELEAAGWKGEAGTALTCLPEDEAFFREASESLAAAGGLCFLELRLDGRPVAITANYRHGDTVFLFKSAYDPECSKLSPGIVALLHLTRLAHEEPGVRRLDSCAGDDSHLEQLWEEGFPFGEVLVATGALSGLAVSSLPWLRESRDLVSRAVASVDPGAA